VTEEEKYIRKRLGKARWQSVLFYLFRIFPVKKNKIVFCCIEGTTGYTCNPKYIAEEMLRRNASGNAYELVWLVNDTAKKFPQGIRVAKNNLWNRAYHLTTAGFWIDNSRKQLEVRKRRGQIYLQTWHAKLGFKPTCLDRGSSFTRIAYLVSKHDSDMVDYWLSNSDWYDRTLANGSLYEGRTLRVGSPRCDILVRSLQDKDYKTQMKRALCLHFGLDVSKAEDAHFLMYAPTFRGGSQQTNRTVEVGDDFPDYGMLRDSLRRRFGGDWMIVLRLHPQLVARHLDGGMQQEGVLDASRVDDMYELLAGCEAFLTDYSSCAFDAAVMQIPVFLYVDDYADYERDRGSLLWNLRKLPFPLAENNEQLAEQIETFDNRIYQEKLHQLFAETGMVEDGKAAERVAEFICGNLAKDTPSGRKE
jgi:CDP-glycerol glycerophosphotransferase